MPRLRRAILISVIASLILLDTYTYLTSRVNISSIIIGEIFQILSFFPYIYAKDRRLGIFTFSTTLLIVFYASASQLSWAWILVYAIVADLIAVRKPKFALVQLSVFFLAQLIAGIPFLPVAVWP